MKARIVTRLRELAKEPPRLDDIRTLLRGRTVVTTSRIRRLKYWGHVARRPAAHILRRALAYRIDGKKKLGRPCFTWHETLTQDIIRSKETNWDQTLEDRKQHEDKCNRLYDEAEESDML